MVNIVGPPSKLQKTERFKAVYKKVIKTAMVRLAYHYSSPCLARLMEQPKPPALLLEMHKPPKKVLKIVPQFRDDSLVYPKQIIFLKHRQCVAPFGTGERVKGA